LEGVILPPTHTRTGAGISGLSSTIVRVCARGSRPQAASWCLARSSTFSTPGAIGSEVAEYANIQFTKASHVLRAMGFDLDKNESARRELAEKGMAP
jgi:hypothetical protein